MAEQTRAGKPIVLPSVGKQKGIEASEKSAFASQPAAFKLRTHAFEFARYAQCVRRRDADGLSFSFFSSSFSERAFLMVIAAA